MFSGPKIFFLKHILKIHKLIFTKATLLTLGKQISLKKEVFKSRTLLEGEVFKKNK